MNYFQKKSERATTVIAKIDSTISEILQEKIARNSPSLFLERDQSERLRRRSIINQRESWRKGNRNARVSQPRLLLRPRNNKTVGSARC